MDAKPADGVPLPRLPARRRPVVGNAAPGATQPRPSLDCLVAVAAALFNVAPGHPVVLRPGRVAVPPRPQGEGRLGSSL